MLKNLTLSAIVLTCALPMILTGCSGSSSSSSSATGAAGGGGGGADARNPNEYKAQDKQLVERSDRIPVYSSPEDARRTMHRRPDEVVEEGSGVQAHYYNADSSPTSERLRLRYSSGRLIAKEILPPDANGDTAASQTAVQKSDAANYIDMREYNPKTAAANRNQASRYSSMNANSNSNANAPIFSADPSTKQGDSSAR